MCDKYAGHEARAIATAGDGEVIIVADGGAIWLRVVNGPDTVEAELTVPDVQTIQNALGWAIDNIE